MNIFKKYAEYLKNNPERYWFKRKVYGWGWTPATWQGWFVLFFFVLFFLVLTREFELNSDPSESDFIFFFGKIILAILVLIFICYKTGEKPHWQWGFPKDKNQKE